MNYQLVNRLKKIVYGKNGEPYNYYGNITRFKVGTRPAYLKYVNSEAWDVRNDILQLIYLKDNFTEGGVLWDIGACNGEYAVLAATLLKTKKNKIFSFEPDRSAMAVLKENLALNGLIDTVTVFPMAVGDKKGKAKFLELNGNANSSLIFNEKNNDGEQNTTIVDCTTLEDLLKELPSPTLVKIDVEGAELNILRAADTLLGRKEITFLVELHPWVYPQYKDDFKLLLQKLESFGRYVRILDEKKAMADMPCYGSIIF